MSSSFHIGFMSNLEVSTEPQAEPFIYSTEVDCSNSLNYERVQVLSCRPIVGTLINTTSSVQVLINEGLLHTL